jgi:hypothetical protein
MISVDVLQYSYVIVCNEVQNVIAFRSKFCLSSSSSSSLSSFIKQPILRHSLRRFCQTCFGVHAVGIATGYELIDRGLGVPSPGSVKNFYFSISSRPPLGPTQPPIRWVLEGSLSGGKAAGAWIWPTHLQLLPRSRKAGLSIHSCSRLHATVLGHMQGQLYFYLSRVWISHQ